ncbi:glutaminyl-tRna synthetase (GlnRS) [Cardiosporidium cionae]|uniref:glutamine--tRNA ligase n=1 Tax=Cardiosporidium cionae TaxID=476202 RepID=A0ABQ7J815_9APIC|nr:glutaminyl-tRna synthetase (GlnRS) [Cardiosporidium cionae]|eukprot:KAF8820134.1 glutaminyl-tRna synthetase (GlnRS) [Cardiosporidium cionae]
MFILRSQFYKYFPLKTRVIDGTFDSLKHKGCHSSLIPTFSSLQFASAKYISQPVINHLLQSNMGTPATHSKLSDGSSQSTSFIKQIIEKDLSTGKHCTIITRFPPEPNGFLHIGHAKSICLNFGLAREYKGRCHMRFDDTNPCKEEMRYIESIKEDVQWLGFDWGDHLYFASDYFPQLFEWALLLISKELAYVDDQSSEEIRKNRGSLTTPGVKSAYRDRSVQENLDLFLHMEKGEFEEGSRVLRAKIDMQSSNMNLRDPILYRILKRTHPRTGNRWCIYPNYDFAHGQSDSIEAITHSLCTLEFELHRPLYEWFQEHLEIVKTRQIEFARMNISYMVMSKRKLLTLVEEGWVEDWDDPRMPTLAGMRRRGITAEAIKDFCDRVGIAKRENTIQIELLESCTRMKTRERIPPLEDLHTLLSLCFRLIVSYFPAHCGEHLNKIAQRRHAILSPLRVILTNYSPEINEELDIPNHPEDPSFGTRKLLFSQELFIDRGDFEEFPSKDFHRLAPNTEVRLRYAYWIKCEKIIKDSSGNITHLECTYDPATKGGRSADGRKVKGTLHWISALQQIPVEFRLFDRLFTKANPEEMEEASSHAIDDQQVEGSQTQTTTLSGWKKCINPNSLKIYRGVGEPSLSTIAVGKPLQFERVGFFVKDKCSLGGAAVTIPTFNMTVDLISSYSQQKENKDKHAEKTERERIALLRKEKKAEKAAKAAQKEARLASQDKREELSSVESAKAGLLVKM